ASISIPAFFTPVKYNGGVLVDGGVINPIPLNRVKRTQGDILVAINVSGRDCHDLHELKRVAISRRDQKKSLLPTIPDVSALIKQQIKEEKEHPDRNYFSLLSKSFSLMIQQNGALSLQLTPPDILIDIPMNKYGSFDYDKAEAISKMGRVEMKKALEEYKLRTQR
ncbi:MAG: phospholipase, partial [Bacteroidales bacterium]|nr:phospholipase [Bacteroidales bacterium]